MRRCANVIQSTDTDQDSIAHCTPAGGGGAIWYSLLLLGYKPVQHVTVLNTVGNCNTVIYRGADKSLARPGMKLAAATKLKIYEGMLISP